MKKAKLSRIEPLKPLTRGQAQQIAGGIDCPDLHTQAVDNPDLRVKGIGLKIDAVSAKF